MSDIEFHIEQDPYLGPLRKHMPELKGPFYSQDQLSQIIFHLNHSAERQVIDPLEENPDLQTVLENAGAVYLFQKSHQDRGTEWQNVQNALRKLDRASAKFREAVDSLNPIARQHAEIFNRPIQNLSDFDEKKILKIRDPAIARYELGTKLGFLYQLAEKLSIAGGALSTRPASRPPSRDFDHYLAQLRKIYEHVTKRKARLSNPEGSKPHGPFLDFVHDCLEPIDPKRCDDKLPGSVKKFLYPTKKKNSQKSASK